MVGTNKKIIGCEEWFSFPELGISKVKARIDSGAQTSTLHAENIKMFKKDNKKYVSFVVHPIQNNRKNSVKCEEPVIARRVIKSSTGNRERRYVIKTEINAGGDNFEVEITLTNRDSMGYRMLLGREAMIGRFIVDPQEHFMLGSED